MRKLYSTCKSADLFSYPRPLVGEGEGEGTFAEGSLTMSAGVEVEQ